MNSKLQREIFNFLALKLKLAFAKSGVGIGKDQTSNFMSAQSAEDFFKSIEVKITMKEQQRLNRNGGAFSNEKVTSVYEHVINTKEPKASQTPLWKRKPAPTNTQQV
jgi:hypothetical protein